MSYMPKSKSDIHETPDRVFDLIQQHWGYLKNEMFDPCPINPQWDGLKIPWEKINFVNPPYSDLPFWVAKAFLESKLNHRTIMLLPSKTDQEFFHLIIRHNYEIRWIRKRLKFKNNKWSATQPHFLVMIK